MSSAMPFAGSAYSWVNVLFGEFFGWVAGWALLAEYFIAVALWLLVSLLTYVD